MITDLVNTQTNSSLSTYRDCGRKGELTYELQLESVDEDPEVLQVGTTWHKAREAENGGLDPYSAIAHHAPSLLWKEKLRRLNAAYQSYWLSHSIGIVLPEFTFKTTIDGRVYEGQIDGIAELPDFRKGTIEYKTTGFDIGIGAPYWDRLRLDMQTALYALAAGNEVFGGKLPDFIIYDVVRKPTINPKNLLKKDIERLAREATKMGFGWYYTEKFTTEQLLVPLQEGRESIEMYGARLTAAIGDDPEKYFQRRPINRTRSDFAAVKLDLAAQVNTIETSILHGHSARNPDACNRFGRCKFARLCHNNIYPQAGAPVPDGFRIREHRHPELHSLKGD